MSPTADRLLASGLGAGWAPWAPGTAGTLAAVPFAWLWAQLPSPAHLALLVGCLPLAAGICGRAARQAGAEDPPWIVLDEMVGYWVAVAWIPPTWPGLAAGFVLFRLFDILKPPPVGWVDRSLRGGWGILMDDVVAGLCARLTWALVQPLFPP
ncbi:MAG: phosphatidylglycerophosphatase A [Deferrisomatales bacterium]